MSKKLFIVLAALTLPGYTFAGLVLRLAFDLGEIDDLLFFGVQWVARWSQAAVLGILLYAWYHNYHRGRKPEIKLRWGILLALLPWAAAVAANLIYLAARS